MWLTWEEREIHLDSSIRSDRIYQEPNQELPLDIQYCKTGSSAAVEKPDDMVVMEGLVERLRRRGMHCQILSNADLRELEPNLAPELAGEPFLKMMLRLMLCMPLNPTR